jgi:cell division initiation protein
MELTPRDINEKQFHDAWRGYNQEEVDDFLDRVAEAVERLHRENESLRRRISDLDQVVAHARETESMLKKTLVSAQKAAEDSLTTAKTRAEKLITEAEERVKRANEEARERVKAAEEEARERVKAATEEAKQRVKAAEEEAKRKSDEAKEKHEVKARQLDSSIERLVAYEAELKENLRSFLKKSIKTLDELTPKDLPAHQRPDLQPDRSRPQPAPEPSATAPRRLHAASASSYWERENTRPVDAGRAGEREAEHRGARAERAEEPGPVMRPEPVDGRDRMMTPDHVEEPDPVMRRRRTADEHPRRGIRGFFWGGEHD